MTGISLLAALAAFSQLPADLPPSLTFPRPDRVLIDEVDGKLWTLGHTYKASVDADGLTYWPLLGPDAEEPVSLSLRLKSVAAGGQRIDLQAPTATAGPDGGAGALSGAAHQRISLDRGPVVESYLFRLESVEQVFEVDLREIFDGERSAITLDVELDTEAMVSREAGLPLILETTSAEHAGPLVRMSRAFVLGSEGEQIPLEARSTSSGFSIDVPASIVREAGDVLVVDPVISSGVVTQNTFETDVVADVASIGDEYFVAVERRVMPGDHDVSIYRVDRSGPLQAVFVAAVDFTILLYTEPAISGLDALGDMMVAATQGSGTARRVFLRRFNTNGAVLSPPFSVWNTSLEAYEPDLGAETGGNFLAKRYCLVFTDVVFGQTGTVALVLNRDGSRVGNALFLDGFEEAEAPAVSNGTGRPRALAPQAFRVAQKRIEGGSFQSIWAGEISRDATWLTAPWKVADTQNTNRVSIASDNESRLADGSSPYLVAWDSGSTFLGDVYLAMCIGNQIRGAISNLSVLADQRMSFDQRAPSVAVTESQWLLTYQERQLPFGESQTYLCSGGLTEAGPGLAERNQRLLLSSDPQIDATVATSYDGGVDGAAGNQGLAIWTNTRPGGATEGARVVPAPREVAGVQYCRANQNSTGTRAWLVAEGDESAGSVHRIRCVDAPPAAPCYVLTSRSTAFVANIGGGAGNLCLGGAGFGRFAAAIGPVSAAGTYTLTFDPGAISQPNGPVAALPGETWYFQAWFRDAGGAGVATSNLSNGVAIKFVP